MLNVVRFVQGAVFEFTENQSQKSSSADDWLSEKVSERTTDIWLAKQFSMHTNCLYKHKVRFIINVILFVSALGI